jgi:signal transduction histidine kinase
MNAVKYNREKGRVDIRCIEDSDQTVTVEVADTGIGIPEEDLGNIFDLFSRGKEARKDIASGLGLGLALVKEIVGSHDGSVEIASDLGVGTRVTIKLPLFGL